MKRQKHITTALLLLLLAGYTGMVHADQAIANFRSTITVNALLSIGKKIYAASTGGLYDYDTQSGTGTLHSDSRDFPDLELTALALTDNGDLWIGSRRGFLYCRHADGSQSTFTGYSASGWSITTMLSNSRYLFIGTDKGCSVFDLKQKIAIKNASRFGSLKSTRVNAIALHHDSLFVSTGDGIAQVAIAGNALLQANFFDQGIWTTTPSAKPILSLIETGDSLLASTKIAVISQNTLFTGHEQTLDKEGTLFSTLPSTITCLYPDNSGTLWIGTSENYFNRLNGNGVAMITIPGPTFTDARRVFVDSRGLLWVMPAMTDWPAPGWWKGIASREGNTWRLHNQVSDPLFGLLGDSPNQRGLCEDQFGNLWFGCSGGNVKFYSRTTDTWNRYCAMATGGDYEAMDKPAQGHFQQAPCPSEWGKVDAIGRDSSGYLWIGCWRNGFGTLICYDPRFQPDPSQPDPEQAHYRRFFPRTDINHIRNLSVIHISPQSTIQGSTSTIFAASDADENGTVLALEHTGNPLADGVIVTHRFTGLGAIYDMTSSPDGTTWMATGNGLYKYNSAGSFDSVYGATMDCRSVKAEDNARLWIGTADRGVVQYDVVQRTQRQITADNGLLSNVINDLFLDKKQGTLWAATDQGVSRISLGYIPDPTHSSTSSPRAYPNPFPLSSLPSRAIIFSRLPAGAKVNIYTCGGTFVATAPSISPDNIYGTTCAWKPNAKISPGTYFYTVVSTGKRITGKVFVVP